MDTKSKNIKYSIGLKITAVILVWLCFMSSVGSGIFLIYNRGNLRGETYYDTSKFKSEFSSLIYNAVELNIVLKSEESIRSSGEGENAIRDKLASLYSIKDILQENINFAYYIKNTQTGEYFTNTPSGDTSALIEQPSAIHINEWQRDLNYPQDIKQALYGRTYEVYAAVVEPLKEGDIFYDDYVSFTRVKALSLYAKALFPISIVLLLAASIYLVYAAGRREEGGQIVLGFIDSIYTDVHSLLVIIAAFISMAVVASFFSPSNTAELIILAAIVLSIDVFIGLSYILSMARQAKAKQIFKNSLTYRAFSYLKDFSKLCFNGKIFKSWTLLLLLAYGMINVILTAGTLSRGRSTFLAFVLLLTAFNGVTLYFAANSLMSLSHIMGAAKEISKGNLDISLDSYKISVAFSGFAEDIENIQQGMRKAVAEAVKGERMKTELITNVSHDLKTPLTSIVNYVGLLKKEELGNEKVKEYVCILEEKSAKLKHLIEDLVEASKASSGNLAVNNEKIDIHELILQAMGEYEEKIAKAELNIVIDAGDDKTSILADGRHMWRIVENLFSNVIKYSMNHSRVYINIDKSDMYGRLTIKNISAFPLNISPEQLKERFVRGDASRSTEGSGLGLSIAQSLVTLQRGRFTIDIDGDLFKVTVEIPLWMEA